MLTELEGAVLSEVHHRGRQTAFQVRRSFAVSPSLEWRGSAGAVYPAIKRLEKQGFIDASETVDKRATRLLSVTESGRRAMMEWACDATRAVSSGMDPFRIRAGIWFGLEAGERLALIGRLRTEIEANIAYLRGFSRNNDTIEKVSVDLARRLQEARLAWLADVEKL